MDTVVTTVCSSYQEFQACWELYLLPATMLFLWKQKFYKMLFLLSLKYLILSWVYTNEAFTYYF